MEVKLIAVANPGRDEIIRDGWLISCPRCGRDAHQLNRGGGKHIWCGCTENDGIAGTQEVAWGESLSKTRMQPHNFREMVNELRNAAEKYQGCQQLREQIGEIVDRYIAIDKDERLRQKCLVMFIKRLCSSLKRAKPESKIVREATEYLTKNRLISTSDILR